MKQLLFCSLSIFAFTLFGCLGGGEPPDDRPVRTPVSGVVTYNGSPIEGATVTFITTEKDGRGASGKTDAQGAFKLGTFESGDGAVPGNFKVRVSKIAAPASAAAVSEDDPNYGGAPEETEAEPKNELPEKYNDIKSTPLEATVGEEAITDLKFDITD